MSEIEVYVTKHAVDQFVARYPDDVPPAVGKYKTAVARVMGKINWEVREALSAGRMKASEPNWLPRQGGPRKKAKRNRLQGTMRYVWTENRERCYVIRRVPAGRRINYNEERVEGPQWHVLTTLRVASYKRAETAP